MKKRSKIALVLTALVLALLTLSGCSGSKPLVKLTPQEGVEPVVLEGALEVEVKDGKITAYLTSNLEVGTLARFTVDSSDGEELAVQTYAISGKNVAVEFALDASWTGKAYVSVVACPSVGSQPKAVTEIYGKFFQNIDGEHIMWNSKENIFVLQSEKLDLG